MSYIAKYAVLFVVTVAAGMGYGMYESGLNVPPAVFYVVCIIVFFAFILFPILYVTYFTKNMYRVEKFLMRYSNKPYYGI
ncbi:hypothetical protein [Paenibacillus sp. JDR-2]|uniref:hypothetical protein n=1 Tax=Paenibacillus sp. (strain JDR-2) TaxID=324057 RepID=UPI0001664ABC|nr:hypothetical protein [Paenibacillus sp. JDR-2]ACT04129.1 hypothetical protein Pjdr2_5520 [Paenibacillus sp. JDR-2]